MKICKKAVDSHTVAACRITALKDMGFHLSAIREMLNCYDRISEVYSAVYSWVEANGYEPDGLLMNIYHVSPHETDNLDEYVTEVCLPVKKK